MGSNTKLGWLLVLNESPYQNWPFQTDKQVNNLIKYLKYYQFRVFKSTNNSFLLLPTATWCPVPPFSTILNYSWSTSPCPNFILKKKISTSSLSLYREIFIFFTCLSKSLFLFAYFFYYNDVDIIHSKYSMDIFWLFSLSIR